MNCFFINSNLSFEHQILDYKSFLSEVGGNVGNSYITYALIKKLYGKFIKVPHIPCIYNYDFEKNADKDIDYINNNCTHVFLILQDQIRINESYSLKLPYKKIINFLKKLKKPILIAGLGANSFNGYDKNFYKKLQPDLILFLKELSNLVECIGLRGCFTQEVLSQLGINNTEVIGCPSYFELGKNRFIVKKDIIEKSKILLTSSSPLKSLKYNYQCMQDWGEEKFISIITAKKKIKKFKFKEIINLYNKKYKIFSSIEEWKNFIKNFDFAFGARLHGSIIAINSGIPAMCYNSDSRATEMCEYLKIPHYTQINKKTNIFDLYDIVNIDELNNVYPILYDKYENFLKKCMQIKEFDYNISQEEFIQPQFNLYSNFNILKCFI